MDPNKKIQQMAVKLKLLERTQTNLAKIRQAIASLVNLAEFDTKRWASTMWKLLEQEEDLEKAELSLKGEIWLCQQDEK